jgi:SNF2 family DNA or RNA helicase
MKRASPDSQPAAAQLDEPPFSTANLVERPCMKVRRMNLRGDNTGLDANAKTSISKLQETINLGQKQKHDNSDNSDGPAPTAQPQAKRRCVKPDNDRQSQSAAQAVLELERCFQRQMDLRSAKSDAQAEHSEICRSTGLRLKTGRSLRPYQVEIIFWIQRMAGGLVCAEMGLGKTAIGLCALSYLCLRYWQQKTGAGLGLAIVPSDLLCASWLKEASQLFPDTLDPVVFISYADWAKVRHQPQTKPTVVIATYDTLTAIVDVARQALKKEAEDESLSLEDLLKPTIFGQKFDLICADESHRVANPKTFDYKALLRLQGAKRFGFSGTPLTNSMDDVRAQLSWCLGIGPVTRLSDKALRDYLFVLKNEEAGVALPPKAEKIVSLDMPPETRALYNAVKASKNILPIVKGTLQRQICIAPCIALENLKKYGLLGQSNQNWLSDLQLSAGLGAPKMVALRQTVEEKCLRNGAQLLVISSFATALALALKTVPKTLKAELIDGEVPIKERREIVQAFKRGQIRVLFMTYGLGGEGHNFQNCSTVALIDRWWTESSKSQAESRAFRSGQTQNVEIIQYEMRDSIDQHVAGVAKGKGNQLKNLFAVKPKEI